MKEMEIEASISAVAKKLWNIARIVVMMMRKGMSKSKIMMELNLLLKRGKVAGKAIAHSFIDTYYSSRRHYSLPGAIVGGGCRSNDAISFISPRDYEFSCSNSPAVKPFHHHHRHHGKHRHHHHHNNHHQYDDVSTTVNAVQKMLEMYYNNNNNLNHHTVVPVEASPMVYLPGFGKSPVVPVRQLRITDSPFPLKDEGLGDSQVDRKAEDFIKKFYRNLKRQNRSTAYIESPCREVYG